MDPCRTIIGGALRFLGVASTSPCRGVASLCDCRSLTEIGRCGQLRSQLGRTATHQSRAASHECS
jgi:hypothetical protein